MSDRIYSTAEPVSIDNFVILAEACHGVLTKVNFANGSQKDYDHVKLFNFVEYPLTCLYDLYALSIGMITEHNRCFIRARLKDETKWERQVRKSNGEEATLILQNQNWVPIDVDWSHPFSSGNLKEDAILAVSELPEIFKGVDYFAVASSSYGFKPGIRMRLFFWNQHPVSNLDIKNALSECKIADPALYNPIQLIYTSEPIGLKPPINRIVWKKSLFNKPLIIPITDHQNIRGAPELWYSKARAELNKAKHFERIAWLSPGDRHPGLIREGIPLGKLVGQGHYEREVMIEEMMDLLDDNWTGVREVKKDRETIIYAIDKGINAMDRGNV